ncbi:MAG: DUF2642 domain-containing protein [Solibacillus sp.]|uniref:DUF2642 domain-containing protein n=1 Tax=unclassified Solibacillus TaxID=2637870 RepID=UPI0030F62E34
MWQLRERLNTIEGLTLEVTTEYSKVTGTLHVAKFDYIVLRVNSNLLFIPLGSIKSLAY